MKISPPPSTSISCSTSSSSSDPSQINKLKAKRSRRILNPEKRLIGSSPARRSSAYRGVTRHRLTGRFEAHLWDRACSNPVQNKKGRQVYLGVYDDEEAAAHAYDLAALKYWGPDTVLNFPLSTYAKEFEEMQNVSKEDYLASLRRRSGGFSRGVSKYRGVARHPRNRLWEARIGQACGNKYLSLGTYSTQEAAAAAYDMAAIKYNGLVAVTNFDISNYMRRQPPPQVLQPQHTDFQEPRDVPPRVVLPQIQLPENPDPVDQTSVIDLLQEPIWNLCMNTAYNPIHVSSITLEKTNELLDPFNGSGFEDNIEHLFKESEDTAGSHERVGNGMKEDGDFENSSGLEGGDSLSGIEQGEECGLNKETFNFSGLHILPYSH